MHYRKQSLTTCLGCTACALAILVSIVGTAAFARDADVEMRPPTSSDVVVERSTLTEAASSIAATFFDAVAKQQKIRDDLAACISEAARANEQEHAESACWLAEAFGNVGMYEATQTDLYMNAKAMSGVAAGFGEEMATVKQKLKSVDVAIATMAQLEDELFIRINEVVAAVEAVEALTPAQQKAADQLAVELDVLKQQKAGAEEERSDYAEQFAWLERNQGVVVAWSGVLEGWGRKLDLLIERDRLFADKVERRASWRARVGAMGGSGKLFEEIGAKAFPFFDKAREEDAKRAEFGGVKPAPDIPSVPSVGGDSLQILKDAIEARRQAQ